MTQVLIGNIIAFVGSMLMVFAGLQKEKKKILFVQIIQIALFVISNLVLGGYTGAIINVLNCARDILCYKEKMGTKVKIVIIILAVALSLAFNNMGLIGLFPLIAAVIYIIFMNTKDVVKFKILISFSLVMWLIYDLCIKSYTSSAFDFMSLIANIVAIGLILRKKKKQKTGVQ